MVYWSLSIFSNFFTLIDWMLTHCSHFSKSIIDKIYEPLLAFSVHTNGRQLFTCQNIPSPNVIECRCMACGLEYCLTLHIRHTTYDICVLFLTQPRTSGNRWRRIVEIVKVVYCLFLPIYWSVIVKHENLTSFVCSVYVRYLSVFLPAFPPIIVDTLLVVSGFLQSTKFLKL